MLGNSTRFTIHYSNPEIRQLLKHRLHEKKVLVLFDILQFWINFCNHFVLPNLTTFYGAGRISHFHSPVFYGSSLWQFFFNLQVPGAEGNFVFIKDAVYKKPDAAMLPFPTYFAPEDENVSELEPLVADLGEVDPFMAAD